MAMETSKLAVDTRTFPVLIYDPRKGDKIAQRLSLQGNPSEKTDFFIEPKPNKVYDFICFAALTQIHADESFVASRQVREVRNGIHKASSEKSSLNGAPDLEIKNSSSFPPLRCSRPWREIYACIDSYYMSFK